MNSTLKQFLLGIGIWIAGFIFCLIETTLFGSHWWPESVGEWIYDSMALFICLCGAITMIMVTIKPYDTMLMNMMFKKKRLCNWVWVREAEVKYKISLVAYWLKCFIVIFFGIEREKQDYSEIPILHYGYWNNYEGYSNWTEVAVGRGLWSNWYYTIYSNGT